MTLHLFHWDDVCADYTSGEVWVVALDVRHAREILLQRWAKQEGYEPPGMEHDRQQVAHVEPDVIDIEAGVVMVAPGSA